MKKSHKILCLIGGVVGVMCLFNAVQANTQTVKPPITAVHKLDLTKYLGTWYEIARKPMYFQRQCLKDVQATYTLNVNGNVDVENSCLKQGDVRSVAKGEAFIMNPPYDSQLKVSFLPDSIRWLPIGRGDYWVLKIDENYQTVMVGDPARKYLWILARTPHIHPDVWHEYLNYAKEIGYDVSDLHITEQTER
ncbi:lipocalin family protein [Acinetobacter sp. FNA3]|uniref:Outer membrane lipoprotein Blc n=3 Tax=Acinetobacter TaxID=469 RepID=A0ABU6DUC1_9GAMM|nr:lipocalin family protein [Acinetobacter pollinis]MBF7692919.1 lipocalin family protein [Acinetobacter pollinis]MBF7698522.1 lipocalin family protein [Acinetobacter pollinis]MBF7700502.1 lipocalin family protein [Acinetobacter pollinis]MEB5477451.1 lipocalin family protein [Acinetobacter pollinis]